MASVSKKDWMASFASSARKD
uniref:Uncharacterized protein n=1 Tax=Arundo donax TaxID=35708 RepID=A0A0A8ZRJ5_ARUDO